MEAEAVIIILKRVEAKECDLVSSDAIDVEIMQIPDVDRLNKVKSSSSIASIHVPFDDKVQARANVLEGLNIYGYDALHLACAEEANVDVFFTTDEELLKKYKKFEQSQKMLVINPLQWISDVI